MQKITILITTLLLLISCTEHKSEYVQVDQGKLYYQSYGNRNNTPIIVLHGGPGMLDSSYLMPELKELAQDTQVIFYDQRGSGKSLDTPINEQLMTTEQFVKDLDELRQNLNLKKVILLGHSWGGVLAMNYAIKHPDNVDKLILLSTAPADFQGMQAFDKNLTERTKNIANEIAPIFSPSEIAKLDIDKIYAIYRKIFLYYVNNPADVNKINLSFNKNSAISGVKTAEMLVKTGSWNSPSINLFPQLKHLTTPALVIHCKEDIIPLWTAEKIKTSVPNAEMVYMDKCGHFPFIEQPEETFAAIHEFINHEK